MRISEKEKRTVLYTLLAGFTLHCLVQAFVANRTETCAMVCDPYAPEFSNGECYCDTTLVKSEMIPGED